MDKLDKRIDKINEIIDVDKTYLYRNNKVILIAQSFKKIKEDIKQFENPSKDLKVYSVDFSLDKNPKSSKYPLIINCTQTTLTPKLNLVVKMEDMTLSVSYTKEELIKYGFKKSHINMIIKAIKYNLLSYDKLSVSITNLLKANNKIN